jgi:tetratricopeptide (TPR) repeat protein
MYKTLAVLIVMIMFIGSTFAQTPMVDRLINEGVDLFDQGDYDAAIKKYEKAIDLNPKNMAARYELAYTWYTKGDFKKAIEHSQVVVQVKKDYWIDAIVIYGASYENLGKSKRAIKIFEEGLKERPDHAQLRYNAALSYFNLKQYDLAERYLTIAVEQDKANTSAHLLLANVELVRGEKLKSMMALYYFLLLEQNTDRTIKAFDMLQAIWENLAKSGEAIGTSKTTTFSSPFKNVELKLATNQLGLQLPTELQTFTARSQYFTQCLSAEVGNIDGFWKLVYVDFYADIDKKGFALPFANFAAQSKYKDDVVQWLGTHYKLFGEFTKWMSAQ